MDDRETCVLRLAERLGCRVVWRKGSPKLGSFTVRDDTQPVIRAPKPACSSSYLTNLHELGHVALGHTAFLAAPWWQGAPTLVRECEAWQWAFRAFPDADRDAMHGAAWALGSYIRRLTHDLREAC